MMRWFERQRYLLDYTLSSLWRRKGRNLSILVVYGLVVFMVSSVIFFTSAIRMEAQSILQDSPEMIVQRIIAGRHDLIPLSYKDRIEGIRGIQQVKTRLWGYYYHPAARATYTLMVPEDYAFGQDEVMIGHGVSRTWGTAVGSEMYFKAYDGKAMVLKIADVFSAGTDLVSADLILTSEPVFRRLTGVPDGFATDLAVSVRNLKEAPVISKKIVAALPDTRPILKEEILRTYTSLFGWRSGYMVVLLSGAILAFLILSWGQATGLSTEDKTEIGILKAVGWDTSHVLTMKFWEGTLISLTAFLLGAMGAYMHVHFGSAFLFAHALKGWAILYPKFELRQVIDGGQLMTLFFLTVLPYAFFSIVPAWRVSITDPDLVMRRA